MKVVRVGAATLNQTALAWDHNRQNILSVIHEAQRRGIDILCLPELCVTGYGCEDAFLAPATARMASEVLLEIAEHTRGMVVALGLPIHHKRANYNACCVLADGRVLGFVGKRALAGDGVHYEPRWFKPWPLGCRAEIELGGRRYPMGDLRFDCGGVRIGFEICEDAWIAERPGAHMAQDAVDLILNPSASHFAFGKQAVRRRLVLEGSRAFGVGYVYANLLGNEAGRVIYDGDALIAAQGELLAEGKRFSFSDWALIDATLDIELLRYQYARRSGAEQWPSDAPEAWVHAEHTYPARALATQPQHSGAPWESSAFLKEEEFARAVALGLVDYLRKSAAQGFVVSLSGGADSAAVACLVVLGVRLGISELGFDGLRRRLGPALAAAQVTDQAALCRALLTTVYQSTRNSSETTKAAARAVATALASEHLELDVEPLVAGYTTLIEAALGRALTWQNDDVALQNIQARVRAPSVWLIANLRRALLLSTSNRSEAAVGYATMDGDTAGGLCPIAGIDKAFLRRWLVWLERTGPDGIGAIAALSHVNVQAPTAELRPRAAEQTDEADLMPYELLDAIERAAIHDKRSPTEIYELMQASFPEHAATQLLSWIERFFVLWSRNQWKRERYAPSFHVDDANLDPKTWCRFPILSGGFTRELEELRRKNS